MLPRFHEIWEHHLCTALFVWVGLSSGLWAVDCSFSVILWEMLLCLGSLSRCMTQFGKSFSCWTDDLTFVSNPAYLTLTLLRSSCMNQWIQSAQVPWLQNKSTSSPLHRHARQLAWDVCPDLLCLIVDKCGAENMAKYIHFCLICPKSFGLFRCSSVNVSRAAVFFSQKKGLSTGCPSK